MERVFVSNAYLTGRWGVGPAADAKTPHGPSCYTATFKTRREAEAAADALNGDTRYADNRPTPRPNPAPRQRDRNGFPGQCHKCGTQVAIGEGWLYRYSGANANAAHVKPNLKSTSAFTVKVRCEGCGEPTRN